MKLNICLDGIRFLGGMALMFQWPLGGFWKLKPMKKKKEKSIRYIYIYVPYVCDRGCSTEAVRSMYVEYVYNCKRLGPQYRNSFNVHEVSQQQKSSNAYMYTVHTVHIVYVYVPVAQSQPLVYLPST